MCLIVIRRTSHTSWCRICQSLLIWKWGRLRKVYKLQRGIHKPLLEWQTIYLLIKNSVLTSSLQNFGMFFIQKQAFCSYIVLNRIPCHLWHSRPNMYVVRHLNFILYFHPTILELYHSKKPLTEKVAWFMMFNATFSNISAISSPPTRKDNSNYKLISILFIHSAESNTLSIVTQSAEYVCGETP
jgi:hypothetical protein